MKKERESSFELMRIISMLFIILWHILLHGRFIDSCGNPTLYVVLNILFFVTIVHVNSFVLLMGFFQSKSKFRLSKLLNLILQVMFFSTIMLLICIKLNWIKDYNYVTIFNYSVPSSTTYYWFINSYIVVYMLSDIINMMINKLSRVQFKWAILVSFIVLSLIPYITGYRSLANDGYTIYHFIMLYMIGAYIRKYPIKETYHFKKMSTNGYRFLMLFIIIFLGIVNYLLCTFAANYLSVESFVSVIAERIDTSKYSYSTPFAIIQSIAYFELVRSLKLKSRAINFIAPFVFGIYLFHEFPYVRNNLYIALKIDTGIFYGYKKFVYMIAVVFIIFIIGFVLELIRRFIFLILSRLKPIKWFVKKLKTFVESLNYKINW